MGVKLFSPKSHNRCHFWTVLSPAKGKSKFEILIVKIFILKQKANKYFQLLKSNTFSCYKKKIFFSSRKQSMVPLEKVLQWRIVKQSYLNRFNNIHAYSRIFGRIHTYSGIIKHIQELIKHILASS